jgi:hypothetical protein
VTRADESIHEDIMSNITRSTPYVAPGAPTSPLLLAVASMLVALASLLAGQLGIELLIDPTTAGALAGFLGAAWGFAQNYLARREQAAGVPKLDKIMTEALAEPPPDPEDLPESVERLRALAAGRPVPRPAVAAGAIVLPARLTPEQRRQLEKDFGPLLEPPAPAPRSTMPDPQPRQPGPLLDPEPFDRPDVPSRSGDLLDSDGDPVSVGDLDERRAEGSEP